MPKRTEKRTWQLYVDYGATGKSCTVGLSIQVMVDGKKGYIWKLGRKYVYAKIYGDKEVIISPFDPRIEFLKTEHQ